MTTLVKAAKRVVASHCLRAKVHNLSAAETANPESILMSLTLITAQRSISPKSNLLSDAYAADVYRHSLRENCEYRQAPLTPCHIFALIYILGYLLIVASLLQQFCLMNT